jgi:hypothetical protein
MSLPVVDLAPVTMTYSGGAKELRTVVEVTVDIKDPKAPVKTMNRARRSIGFTRGVPEIDLTLSVVDLVGNPEVDWTAILMSGEEFMFTYETGIGGKRQTVSPCVISEISKPFKEDGIVRYSVKMIGIDHRPGR